MGGVRAQAPLEGRPRSVSAGVPGSGQLPPAPVPAGCWGGLLTLLDGKAERFGMGPLAVPGQRLAEDAGRSATVRWQISQRVTGRWVDLALHRTHSTRQPVSMSRGCPNPRQHQERAPAALRTDLIQTAQQVAMRNQSALRSARVPPFWRWSWLAGETVRATPGRPFCALTACAMSPEESGRRLTGTCRVMGMAREGARPPGAGRARGRRPARRPTARVRWSRGREPGTSRAFPVA
jgi:hypothetical protein